MPAPTRTHLQQLQAAGNGLLRRDRAEALESEVRDLITALETLAEDLDTYATAERAEVADARDTLASSAEDALSDLRAFGFELEVR